MAPLGGNNGPMSEAISSKCEEALAALGRGPIHPAYVIRKHHRPLWQRLRSQTTSVIRVLLRAGDGKEQRLKSSPGRWEVVRYKYFKTTNMIQEATWNTLTPSRAPGGMMHRWQ